MNEDKSIFLLADEEYHQIKKELVIPAYRKFCEELNLPFHFWDELPEDYFDAEISHGEFDLHNEAMDLFNRLKPELVVFQDKIVHFQFVSWDGDFTYDAWPIEQFIDEVADELFYLKNLEHRFDIISTILVFLCSFIVFLATAYLSIKFVPWESIRDASFLLGIVPGIAIYSLLMRIIKKMPHRTVDDGRLDGVSNRIHKLREQLAKIRGSKPDPLRQKRLGKLILQDLQQSMSQAEIEKLVHRLKAKLFVVPREDDSS